ncbi:MAG: hypothetical protein M3Y28_11495, partial [Armatimonadota bacterium]|nr:hypothetical protein [Armatimonadota bacterium]
MAKDPPQHEFLGGGPAFNQAGSGAPPSEDTAQTALRPATRRNRGLILALLVVLLLAVALYAMTGGEVPGMTHTQRHGQQ